MKHSKGFTLVESIITLAIIAVSFTFLVNSLSVGIDASAYRSALKEISISLDTLFDSSETSGSLQTPNSQWKYYKSVLSINGDNYTKLEIVSPKGETFDFYRWHP